MQNSEFQPPPVHVDEGLGPVVLMDSTKGAADAPASAAGASPPPPALPGSDIDSVVARLIEVAAEMLDRAGPSDELDDDAPLSEAEQAETAHVYAGVLPPGQVATVRWGDAVVHGTLDDSILDRTITYSECDRTTEKYGWGNREVTVRKYFGELSRHRVGKKDGVWFTQGSLAGNQRVAKAAIENSTLILDIDNGATLDQAREKVRSFGRLALLYTTHSHMGTITEINRDDLKKWAKLDVNNVPLVEHAVAYLSKEKGYLSSVLDGAKITGTRVDTTKGVLTIVEHQPIPKFRIVFVLEKPFDFINLGSQKSRAEDWKGHYLGLAKLLGLHVDKSCVDVARGFYAPRHGEGKPFSVDVYAGTTLDLGAVPKVSEGEDDPFSVAGKAMGGGRKDYETKNLRRFAAKFGDVFGFDEFMAVMLNDVRGSAAGGQGHSHPCPNRAHHTEADDGSDTAFVALDGVENDGFGGWCLHSGCRGLDRLDLLDLACVEAGVSDAAELLSYCPEIEGRPHRLDDEGQDAGEVDGFADFAAFKTAHDKLGPDATAQDHEDLARRAGASGWGGGLVDDVWGLFRKGTRLSKSTFDQALKAGRASRRRRDADARCAWLPGSYTVKGDWVWTQGDGEGPGLAVCKVFKPIALVRDGDNMKWKLTIAYRTPDGVDKTFLVDFGLLSTEGGKVLGAMMSAGFQMRAGRSEKDAVVRLLGDLMTSPDIARSVLCDQPGWQAGGSYFVSPSGQVIGQAPRGEVVTLHQDSRFKGVSKAGTLEEQVANLADVVRGCMPDSIKSGPHTRAGDRGMPHLLIGIGAALVGPAATLLPAEEGGGVVLVGGSGLGKTTALELGASLWGHPKPDRGALIEASATSNGLETIAAKATANFLGLNELRQMKKPQETLAPLLMALAGGQGTLRMKQDASGNRHTNTWRVFCAVTSEKTLSELVRGEVVDGVYARFPEIMLGDAPRLEPSHPFLTVLKRHHGCYGHVAEAFVSKLIQAGYTTRLGVERLSTEVDDIWRDLSDKMPMASRALRKLAWVAWSLDRAVQWGLLPQDTPVDWAIGAAAESAVEGGAGQAFSGDREVEQFKTNVALFAASNRIMKLEEVGEDAQWSAAHDVVGWMWPVAGRNDGAKTLIVAKDQLLRLVPSGKTAADVAGLLHKEGLLIARREATAHTKRDLVQTRHGMKHALAFPNYKFELPEGMFGGVE